MHGFVHETWRDSLRQGRRYKRGTTWRDTSFEVNAMETARDARDTCRMAHNPEVEGSNPSPATKARGPFSNRERAFCM